MLYMLGGLNVGYESLVNTITNKKRVLSLDKLFTRMRTHDRQMECMNQPDT